MTLKSYVAGFHDLECIFLNLYLSTKDIDVNFLDSTIESANVYSTGSAYSAETFNSSSPGKLGLQVSSQQEKMSLCINGNVTNTDYMTFEQRLSYRCSKLKEARTLIQKEIEIMEEEISNSADEENSGMGELINKIPGGGELINKIPGTDPLNLPPQNSLIAINPHGDITVNLPSDLVGVNHLEINSNGKLEVKTGIENVEYTYKSATTTIGNVEDDPVSELDLLIEKREKKLQELDEEIGRAQRLRDEALDVKLNEDFFKELKGTKLIAIQTKEDWLKELDNNPTVGDIIERLNTLKNAVLERFKIAAIEPRYRLIPEEWLKEYCDGKMVFNATRSDYSVKFSEYKKGLTNKLKIF